MRNPEITGIRWHPGFYSAAELEFGSNKNDLEFQREYHLSKEPIRMDLLVIKKLSDVRIRNELGHIFKRYNVIEYKSPEDGLTIDDYFKTVGYACLYKGLGETVGQIPAEEVTVSIFRESYPRELFKKLKNMGSIVEEYRPGIYYVTGQETLFDTQIIVTRELDKKTHRSMRVLSRNVQEDDVEGFLSEAVRLMEPGDRNNADAILQVSVSANQGIYEKIRRRDRVMCDALKELMKEDFDKMKAEYDKEISKMKEEYDRTKEKYDETKEAYDKTKEKYDKTKEAYDKTKEKYDKTKEKYDKTKEAYDKTKEKYDKTKEAYDKTKEKYDKTKEAYDKTKEKYDKTKEAYDKTKEAYDKMKQESEKKEQATLLETIKNLMDSMKWTAEQAMSAMKIPEADKGKYREELG